MWGKVAVNDRRPVKGLGSFCLVSEQHVNRTEAKQHIKF